MQDGAEAAAAEPCYLLVNGPKGLIIWQSTCAIDSPSRPSFIHEREEEEGRVRSMWAASGTGRGSGIASMVGGRFCLFWCLKKFRPFHPKALVAEKRSHISVR